MNWHKTAQYTEGKDDIEPHFDFFEDTKGNKSDKEKDPEYQRIKNRAPATLQALADQYKDIDAFIKHMRWIRAKFERVDNKVTVYVDGEPITITFPTNIMSIKSQFNLMTYRIAKSQNFVDY